MRVQAGEAIDALRERMRETGYEATPAIDDAIQVLPRTIAQRVEQRLGGLVPVINATGIFIHTNLGRAPLAPELVADIVPLLVDYCDLEMDLESGQRAERNRRAVALLRALCGAQDALVVNNNAAALVLAIACLAKGREVIVSRGELVEIGGSFRIPDILEAAGARLHEVGTTNRTHLDDYRRALGDESAMLLKVHPSNYRIHGFTADCSVDALADLAKEANVPLLFDEGSGLAVASDLKQLRHHSSLRQALDDGVDLVCGSGDKIFGGPQAGLLLGRADLVARCRRHPFYRAMRPGRMVFATLEAAARRHLAGATMPVERLWRSPAEIDQRLDVLAQRLEAHGMVSEKIEANAYFGGGAAPEEAFPGRALALDLGQVLALALRQGRPAVVGYVRDDRLIIDLRTVDPRHDSTLADVLIVAVSTLESGKP